MKNFSASIVSIVLLSACASGGGTTPSAALSAPQGTVRAHNLQVQPLNAPSSQFPTAKMTAPTGIRRNLISATITLTGGTTVGAVYNQNLAKWTEIEVPGSSSTAAYGPATTGAGYRLVGSYKNAGSQVDHGFIYIKETNAYTTLDAPADLCKPKACNFTIAHSSYGGKNFMVVGNYNAVEPSTAPSDTYPVAGHAFLYNSANKKFSTIDVPSATSTTAYGIWIDGSTVAVAGGFTQKKTVHAYVRSLTAKKQLVYDYPHAAVTHFEGITGAGRAGDYNVIGDYTNAKTGAVYGFFLQIRGWVAGSSVVIGALSANSVFERTVVGVYKSGGSISGYTVDIPVIDPTPPA